MFGVNDSREKIVVLNYDRGVGKTTSIIKNILSEEGRGLSHVIVSKNVMYIERLIVKYAKEYGINIITDGFKCKFSCGTTVIICANLDNLRGVNIDYVYLDESLPTKKIIDLSFMINAKKIYSIGTFENVKYINRRSDASCENPYNNLLSDTLQEIDELSKLVENLKKKLEIYQEC